MTLKECINFISVSLEPIISYVAYIDETGYDTTCYDEIFDKEKMLKEISEEDLNKEVLDIDFSVNYNIKNACITIKVKNYGEIYNE